MKKESLSLQCIARLLVPALFIPASDLAYGAAIDSPASVAMIFNTPNAETFGTEVAGSMPLQTIDAAATGVGAAATHDLEALDGLFVNAYWQDPITATQFAQAQGQPRTRNYLAFTEANDNGVHAAFRFHFEQGTRDGVFNGGYNNTGPRIVMTAGESIFLEQALAYDGAYEITVGSYRHVSANERAFGFHTHTLAGDPFATRAVGFFIVGVAEGFTISADFYGIDGELLTTLEAVSPGETTAGENTAGGEIFFGFDAGEDPFGWIHRIVIRGDGGGNIGFDDFGFTPVAAVGEGSLPASAAIVFDTPNVETFATEVAGTMPLQTIDAVATGTGAVSPGALEAMDDLFVNAYWQDPLSGAQFAQAQGKPHTRNYLAFSDFNDFGVKAAFRFFFDQGGRDGVFNGGFNSTGPRIVMTASESIFLEQALATEDGYFAINVGGYSREAADEAAFGWRPDDGAGNIFATRAVGFVIVGIAENKTITADYFGIDGRLLATLEGLSPGETTAGENTAGGEVFFGYDAGEDPLNWVHRVVIRGDGGGNIGFDDFGFLPVAAVSPDGGIVIPELPVPVDESTVFFDRPLWDKFADKDLVPGQSIDIIAGGVGAAAPEDLQALDGLGVNTEFSGFKRVRDSIDNYLYFSDIQAAVQFRLLDDPVSGDEWAGIATHTDALNVSGPPGPQERHAVYLGILNENWISYTITIGSIRDDFFYRVNEDGYPYGVRAAGFVIANVVEAGEVFADFYSIDGRLLTTLEGTGTSGAPMSMDGEEIFFGFDAGEDTFNWIHRIVIRANMEGQAGFDDFGFTPIYAIASDGSLVDPVEPPTEETYDIDGAVIDAPLYNNFVARNVFVNQQINRIASGEGALGPFEMASLPGMRVNTDWQVGSSRFEGKGNRPIVRNALHYSKSDTGIMFTLHHLGTGSNPNSGSTTSGIRETVTGPNAVYVGFLDAGFVEYSITLGKLDPEEGKFHTRDEEDRPYVARGVAFVLSGINDGTRIDAAFHGPDGQLLTTLEGLGTDENGSNGIEILYGFDAGTYPENWIHKIVITGENPNPFGGSRNVGLDDFGFTPITPLGVDAPLIPIWTDNGYPLNEEGFRSVGLGLQVDSGYPWVYQSRLGGWIHHLAESGLYAQWIYSIASGQWIYTSEALGNWYWNFNTQSWKQSN